MKITICGSMKFSADMEAAKAKLERLGYSVELPNIQEGTAYDPNNEQNASIKRGFIDEHFRKIGESDAVLIVNQTKNGVDNYVGGNTLIEIAHAYAQGLEIFLLNPIPQVSYADEITGMAPIVIDGDISKIDQYFKSLPLVVMSTQSPVKHTAVSRAFRKAGIRVRLDGVKVESGVSDQPMSIEEGYDGAVNRHEALRATKSAADYLATIESGLHAAHKDHNAFGSTVIILQKVGEAPKIGIDLDLEYPRDMTDRVPSEYPDLGVLVQQKYGSVLKDPYPFFTNNKLTRAKILENAIYNLAVQL